MKIIWSRELVEDVATAALVAAVVGAGFGWLFGDGPSDVLWDAVVFSIAFSVVVVIQHAGWKPPPGWRGQFVEICLGVSLLALTEGLLWLGATLLAGPSP